MTCDNPLRQCPGQHETRTPSRFQHYVVILLVALVLAALAPVRAQAQQMKLLTPTTGWVSQNGFLYWTTDSGSHWTNITPIPPGMRYAGGVLGVYFLNTQEGWVIVSYPDATVPLTEKALQTRKTLYDIAHTVDGGETWSLLPLTYPPLAKWQQEVLIGPSSLCFLDARKGWMVMAFTGNSQPGKLLSTLDGGRTWNWGNSPGLSGIVHFTSLQNGWLFGGPYDQLFGTRDGGKTWLEVWLPVPPQVGAAKDATFQAPPTFEDNEHGLLAVHYSGPGNTPAKLAVYSTADSGKTWNLVKVVPEAQAIGQGVQLPFALVDSVIFVATGAKSVKVSPVPLAGDVEASVTVSGTGTAALTFADSNNGWALGMDGKLLGTADGGETWRNITPWHLFTHKPAQPGAQWRKPHAPRAAVALSSEAGSNHQGEWQHFGTTRATPEGVPAGADPPQAAGAGRMANLAKQMLVLVNRDRQNPANAAETHGRAQPLKWNEKLAAVALAHSRDMFRRRYFAHVDREGRTPKDRINAAGIEWRALAENIALNQTVADAEKDLMDEPRFQQNHRGNILNPEYTEVGIGIVQAPNGDLYITQDFVAMLPRSGSAHSGP